ncbi:MAG: hypothetical protein ACJAT4_001518 [Granulosicoccus sp.]|jgi:hypothetical protein
MKILLLSILFSLGLISNMSAQQSASFTLKNPTAKSIPLWIPSVMNPNLSPFSSSGVTLKIGQKIYFKHKMRKRLLLEVTKDLDEKSFNLAKLIRERKKELNL